MAKLFITFLLNLIIISFSFSKIPSGKLIIDDNYKGEKIGKHIEIYEDDENLNLENVIKKNKFERNTVSIPNLGLTPHNVWIKLIVENQTENTSFLLNIEYPILNEVEFFYPELGHRYSSIRLIENSYKKRKYKNPDYSFDIHIQKNETKTYYLKVNNTEQIILPISIVSEEAFWEKSMLKNIINGTYTGVILIMFLYNIFLFISTKEKSYFYYVFYVLSTGLTQMGIQGYNLSYFFPNLYLSGSSLTIYASAAGIFLILFTKSFLETHKNIKKLNYGLTLLVIILSVSMCLIVLNQPLLGFNLMQMATTIFTLYILVISFYLLFKGYKQARFFALSMSVVLIGAIIFLLKDYGILPYNNITSHTMQFTSAIEMALLSFALANRINTMRAEKEASQRETLVALKENEKIIREQNIVLEQKVNERTTELNQTLSHLKETQAQLVDAEKMSSLGQLTAGIAHEINNPINFVSSNIPPLRQDIDDLHLILAKYEEINTSTPLDEKLAEVDQLKKQLDYNYLKTELKTIINGIEDGAKRTVEIVSGLKNFSRLDEADLQKADINEGINSTLILIKNKLKGIKIIKELASLPLIECYPSKLNQLFLNIMDNAIQAILAKQTNQEKVINIQTYSENNNVVIAIKDNGIGMSNEVKEKIFEPFFTTKSVGEGTGLGMSIVYSIIKVHQATIEVNSKENEGTELIIKIPFNNG